MKRFLALAFAFLCPHWVGFIPAGLSLGSALFGGGGSSGGSTGGGGANMYTPTGLGGADTGWQQNQQANQGQLGYTGGWVPTGGLAGNTGFQGPQDLRQNGMAGTVDPLMWASLQQNQNINYNPYLQASQQAGQQYQGLSGMAGQAGQAMYGQAGQNFGQQQNLQGMGQSLWNTAQDPQNALHDRLQQQTMDRSNVVNSMYGLGSSGQGAEIANQNLNNFNMDWQNQQLGRQMQGAQGVSSLQGAADKSGLLGSADLQSGMGYYGQQPGFTQQGAQVPLGAQQMVAGMPQQNAQQYISGMSSAMTPYMQQQNQSVPYMNYGSGAGANAFSNNLQQQQFQNHQMGQMGNVLGNTPWGNLSGMFGGGGSSGGGGGVDPFNFLGGSGTAGDYSDVRLKTDIEPLGLAGNGLPLYRFRYVWGGPARVGHMAHEVAEVFPDAVSVDADGYMMVNYAKV